jgi:hypothetical protein
LLDTRGNLWVSDFGLAQVQSEAGLALTLTGDVLGTLRYMSPEQALGRRTLVDHRSDIYALGVTLYELLTLRPAVGGSDRQEILRRIAFEDTPGLRRSNPAAPRELETIVLKAMAKEPEGRYATAQELADDLKRFLENRPIQARRPSLMDRSVKWGRRHPSFLMSASVLLAMTVIGLAVGSMLLARERLEVSRQRDRANELAGIANAQRALAEQNARLARQAVDEMYTQVAESWLAGQPKLEGVQRQFLERALGFYEQFARYHGDDPEAIREAARACRRAGDIRLRFGQLVEAEAALRAGISLLESPHAGREPTDRKGLSNEYNSLGMVLFRASRMADAERAFRRSLELNQEIATRFPDFREYRNGLAIR